MHTLSCSTDLKFFGIMVIAYFIILMGDFMEASATPGIMQRCTEDTLTDNGELRNQICAQNEL